MQEVLFKAEFIVFESVVRVCASTLGLVIYYDQIAQKGTTK